MRIQTGHVVGGKTVVVDNELELEVGTVVTILVKEPEDEQPVELSAEQEAELLESIAEAGRSELIPIAEVLADLD